MNMRIPIDIDELLKGDGPPAPDRAQAAMVEAQRWVRTRNGRDVELLIQMFRAIYWLARFDAWAEQAQEKEAQPVK